MSQLVTIKKVGKWLKIDVGTMSLCDINMTSQLIRRRADAAPIWQMIVIKEFCKCLEHWGRADVIIAT